MEMDGRRDGHFAKANSRRRILWNRRGVSLESDPAHDFLKFANGCRGNRELLDEGANRRS
jgi:hypothetical protein